MVPLSTTIGVAIAVALLFGASGLAVGVVIGICGTTLRLRSKHSASVELSGARPVGAGFEADTIPGPIPEYEEITLKETKRVDIQLTDNAAYGVGLK